MAYSRVIFKLMDLQLLPTDTPIDINMTDRVVMIVLVHAKVCLILSLMMLWCVHGCTSGKRPSDVVKIGLTDVVVVRIRWARNIPQLF